MRSYKVVAPVLAILVMIFWASRFFFSYETTMELRFYHTALSAGCWLTAFAYAALWPERKQKADLLVAVMWFFAGVYWLQNL